MGPQLPPTVKVEAELPNLPITQTPRNVARDGLGNALKTKVGDGLLSGRGDFRRAVGDVFRIFLHSASGAIFHTPSRFLSRFRF